MILPIIFLFIEKIFLQFDPDAGTNFAIIVFIVVVLAVAVIIGRRFSNKKRR